MIQLKVGHLPEVVSERRRHTGHVTLCPLCLLAVLEEAGPAQRPGQDDEARL